MKITSIYLACTIALAAGAAPSFAANWNAPARPAAPNASDACAGFDLISGDYPAAAGLTNGMTGTPEAGETYSITVSGPGTGSFRLVGDSAGLITFAGPTNVPATLTYTIPSGPLPVGLQGVGFFFDSGAGDVTVSATCSTPAITVPASSFTTQWLLGAFLLVGGGFWLARMRGSAA
ncbi:MAG TPA: hypothetical protein VFN29_13195 [Chiayiivirga sp.]|nr:hypothetical protein [Chiayiivirga sp.]